jgi:hypothetical protein
MTTQVPTLGRIVQYYKKRAFEPCAGPFAATVIGVGPVVPPSTLIAPPALPTEPTVSLFVMFPDEANERIHNVPEAATPTAGCWTWPPRV